MPELLELRTDIDVRNEMGTWTSTSLGYASGEYLQLWASKSQINV